MRRVLFLVLCAAALSGFTLISVNPQTARVSWNTYLGGATYSTPAAEEADFSNPFYAYGGNSASFGDARFKTDFIQCTWQVAGTGAGNVDVKIVHEDGGIDAQCTLGACTATAGVPLKCTFTAFQTLASTSLYPSGPVYRVQLDDATSCASTDPAQISCSVDWLR